MTDQKSKGKDKWGGALRYPRSQKRELGQPLLWISLTDWDPATRRRDAGFIASLQDAGFAGGRVPRVPPWAIFLRSLRDAWVADIRKRGSFAALSATRRGEQIPFGNDRSEKQRQRQVARGSEVSRVAEAGAGAPAFADRFDSLGLGQPPA